MSNLQLPNTLINSFITSVCPAPTSPLPGILVCLPAQQPSHPAVLAAMTPDCGPQWTSHLPAWSLVLSSIPPTQLISHLVSDPTKSIFKSTCKMNFFKEKINKYVSLLTCSDPYLSCAYPDPSAHPPVTSLFLSIYFPFKLVHCSCIFYGVQCNN